MENTPAADIFETTRLLKAWSEGDETALERLVPLVDAELRRLARQYLRQERPDHILPWKLNRTSPTCRQNRFRSNRARRQTTTLPGPAVLFEGESATLLTAVGRTRSRYLISKNE
jgi:hypothetical protein